MLVLFDIDGTLLLSQGQGARAMQEAARKVVGPTFTFEGVEFAGRLDPLIFRDGLRKNGCDDFDTLHGAFRAAYEESLRRRLSEPGIAAPLPGVTALLARLREPGGPTLGLVTGNYPETGRIKLEAAGLHPAWFEIPVWGVDGPTRRDLPRVALDRYAERLGHRVDPARVVVIGDTPYDVDCAHHNGCRALAVATGPAHGKADLASHHPDLLLDDLRDVDRIMAWLHDVR